MKKNGNFCLKNASETTKKKYLKSDFEKAESSQIVLNSDDVSSLKSRLESPLLPWLNRSKELGNVIDESDELIGFGWWIEIFTLKPICLYYFGLFDQRLEATLSQGGYIKDLQAEGAEIIAVQTKRCQPRQLTITQSDIKSSDFRFLPSLISEGGW